MRRRNKLYTANRWNVPSVFAEDTDREHQNLFGKGGGMNYLQGHVSQIANNLTSDYMNKYKNMLGLNNTTSSNINSGLIGKSLSNTSGLFSTTSGLNYSTPQISKPTFSTGSWNINSATNNVNSLAANFSKEANANNPFKQYTYSGAADSSGNGSGSSGNGWKIAGGIAASLGSEIGKSDKYQRGLFDMADPLFHLADGKESTFGNTLSDAGVDMFKSGASSGNPWIMFAGGLAKATGSLVNTFWGTKWNKELIERIENNTNLLKQGAGLMASASNSDDFFNKVSNLNFTKYSFTNDDVGEDGVFANRVGDKVKTLRQNQDSAYNYMSHALSTSAKNVDKAQDDRIMSNFVNTGAFGGQLATMSNSSNNNMGAIGYGFMSDYLTAKNRQIGVKDKVSTNPFGNLAVTPLSTFALGGDIQTNGADWSNGLTHIAAGGTHEENPYDGVQVGISSENGLPNLVEEGETIFDDYVFSKRIKVDADTKKKFHLGRHSEMTFADLSKKLEKESLERPNDAISQAGLKKQMQMLQEEQERQKQEMQQQEAEEAFKRLPPEQQQAVMQQMALEEQQAAQQQQAMQEGAPQMEGGEQMSPEQMQQEPQQQVDEQMQQQQPGEVQMEEQLNAYGGNMNNRFDDGGDLALKRKKQLYKLLKLYTDPDWDKWRTKHKVDEIADWSKVFENESVLKALQSSNPDLADAIKNGYNFDSYKAPTQKYDWDAFSKQLGDYKASLNPGFAKGNYKPDPDFDLRGYKDIKEYEDSDWHQNYTKYMADVIKRAANVKYKEGKDGSYKDVQWADPNNKLSEDDYKALQILAKTTLGTSTKDEGKPVPMFNQDADGYQSLAEDASDIWTRLRGKQITGIFHLNPDEVKRPKTIKNLVVNDDGSINEVYNDIPQEWSKLNSYDWGNEDGDFTYNYYKRPAAAKGNGTGDGTGEGEKDYTLKPNHKTELPRLASIFGPTVALGLQMAGVGKSDYSHLDAAVDAASGAPALAQVEYIGDYIGYKPMGLMHAQSKLDANARATDRAILNNASPIGTKNAGLIANAYNRELAVGNLHRQGLEYDDDRLFKTAGYNKDTNKFNATAFNDTSKTNAQLRSNQRQFKAQMMMNAARERMESDASWTSGKYANLKGIFEGLGAIGKENAQHNMIADMAANNVFGAMDPDSPMGKRVLKKVPVKKAVSSAQGGKINRRKGKRKGLTF